MPTYSGIQSGAAKPLSFALKGINLGAGPASWDGTATFGRFLQAGASQNTSPPAGGSSSGMALTLALPGFWRFRWTVQPGTRTITVQVYQSANISPYPSVIVKANTSIGVSSDVTGTSAGGTGWVSIGPITVTPTSEGVLWVQLWNNLHLAQSPCYFDKVIVT